MKKKSRPFFLIPFLIFAEIGRSIKDEVVFLVMGKESRSRSGEVRGGSTKNDSL
jgi:hypothetical protein